jgi:hypothetical protein
MQPKHAAALMALCLTLAGCNSTPGPSVDGGLLPIVGTPGPAYARALAQAEQQCQVLNRHARYIAKDSTTGRASFDCTG